MAISRVEVEDLLVFKGEFTTKFSPGVNVLIGGNATGKTTLMKVLHWACEFADNIAVDKGKQPPLYHKKFDENHYNYPFHNLYPFNLRGYFDWSGDHVATYNGQTEYAKIRVSELKNGGTEPGLSVSVSKTFDISFMIENDDPPLAMWCNRNLPSVFIPTTEMLSHSRGFLALIRERQIPFNKTEVDIVSKAELEPTREITPNAAKVIKKLTAVIDGTVSYDGKDFYVDKKTTNTKVPFSFEASGYRKLGLLWRLLRNGLLEAGSILFWDEPENSLNPEHISTLVDVLLELSRGGVQIFIATHSEILSSYFAVNRQSEDEVMFISLYIDGEQIKANTDNRFDLLKPNNLTAEIVKLYEKEIEKGLGGS